MNILNEQSLWHQKLSEPIPFFTIGALYNPTLNYYGSYDPRYHDTIIYFDNTSAAIALE